MDKNEVIKKLKAYQIEQKLGPNESTGYTGLADREIYTELNQLINSNLIPLFSFLTKEGRLTNEEVASVLNDFFLYLHYKKIDKQLDTVDKEELLEVIMNILRIIEMEHIPISFV